jgi:acetate CoA/acetoacetate CoA-transferase beta subunit
LIVTELAVIEPTDSGLCLRERGKGVDVEAIRKSTSARLVIPEVVPEMPIPVD